MKVASDIAATNTGAASSLALAKLPLALQLCELRLFGEDLVPSLLHVGAVQWPISESLGAGWREESVGLGVSKVPEVGDNSFT